MSVKVSKAQVLAVVNNPKSVKVSKAQVIFIDHGLPVLPDRPRRMTNLTFMEPPTDEP